MDKVVYQGPKSITKIVEDNNTALILALETLKDIYFMTKDHRVKDKCRQAILEICKGVTTNEQKG